jgi:hypothetical protein
VSSAKITANAVAWISDRPEMGRPLTSNTSSVMKEESKRAVSFVLKAITHRCSASTTASRPVRGGLRTAGREKGDAIVPERGFVQIQVILW